MPGLGGVELHDLAVFLARRAVREGASEAEVYIVRERGYSATASSNRVEGLNIVDEAGAGVRVAVGKKTGFAYTTSLSKKSLEEAVERAVKLARTSREDKHWRGFPPPSESYPEPGSIYATSLARVSPEDVVEDLGVLLSRVLEERATLVGGEVLVLVVDRVLVNTSGVYRLDAGTLSAVYAEVSMQKEGVTTPGIYELESSRVAIPQPEKVAERAIEKAKLCLKKAKIDSAKKMTIVFSPKAFAQLLRAGFLEALLGDNVARGRSVFKDRVGEEVASRLLTIIDDGTLKGGDRTWRFDGEGVAMQKTVLVERGVLKSFVFDYYWASRLGLSSTGNAVRSGYSSRPAPGFTNIVVSPGDSSLEEMLEEREVLFVEDVQGAHTTNPDTGEYSVLTNPSILYSRGEPVGWTPGVMVSGNMHQELKNNLDQIGKILEHPLTGYYLPPVRMARLAVAPKH